MVHETNRGYGGNQKTCYTEALRLGADVVVMLHPDYQYTPKLLPAMISMLDRRPLRRGSRLAHPGWRRARAGCRSTNTWLNRFLTATQNAALRGQAVGVPHGLSRLHREVLERLPLLENSDDFVFDNQMLAQIIHGGFAIGEVSCPAVYFEEASSINFRRSVRYGLGVLGTSFQLFMQRRGWASYRIFAEDGRRLEVPDRDASDDRGDGARAFAAEA